MQEVLNTEYDWSGNVFSWSNLTQTLALKLLKFLKFSALKIFIKLLSFFHGKKSSHFIQSQAFASLDEGIITFSLFN